MTGFLFYDLKAGVLIAVCYLLYRLLLGRDTGHRESRLVLLASMALSLVLPLCVITLHQTVTVEGPLVGLPSPDASGVSPVAAVSLPLWRRLAGTSLWVPIFSLVLVAGVLVRLAMLARYYLLLQRLIRSGHCLRQPDGTALCIVDAPVAPFSWWHTVVISRTDYGQSDAALLLAHERSHIRLHHSMDVVFVELFTALQWFNPAVWMLSRDLRTIHEYEADEAVLSQGAGKARYITLLTCRSVANKVVSESWTVTDIQACVLANGVGNGNLKKRIDMMMKPKSDRRWSRLKALYVIPVAAIALAATAKTVTEYQTIPAETQTVTPPPANSHEPAVDVCDLLPQFPGGQVALMEFLVENMKYPEEAQNFGVEGRVVVRFVVENDGSITHVEAKRVIDPSTGADIVVVGLKPDMTEEQQKEVKGRNAGVEALKAEAERVVGLMPRWTPGKQDGKSVRVNFFIPVTFRLN